MSPTKAAQRTTQGPGGGCAYGWTRCAAAVRPAQVLQKLVQVDDAEGAQWRTSWEASIVDRLGCPNGGRA